MKYMGSKARHAKEILAVIAPYRNENQAWVEPFVGGANMIDRVEAPLRIGGDFNEYVIALFHALQLGWVPPDKLTEAEYAHYREYKECYDKALIGYVGFPCSYGAKWFGGYCRSRKESRDYIGEAFRNVTKQAPHIQDVIFVNASYDELPFPDASLIYCDPPYEGTTKYRDAFDHDKFWQWCRDKSDGGHTVFVSEYNAPADFVPIWEKRVNSSLTKDTGGKQSTEKLFVYIPQLLRDGIRKT